MAMLLLLLHCYPQHFARGSQSTKPQLPQRSIQADLVMQPLELEVTRFDFHPSRGSRFYRSQFIDGKKGYSQIKGPNTTLYFSLGSNDTSLTAPSSIYSLNCTCYVR